MDANWNKQMLLTALALSLGIGSCAYTPQAVSGPTAWGKPDLGSQTRRLPDLKTRRPKIVASDPSRALPASEHPRFGGSSLNPALAPQKGVEVIVYP